MACLVLSQGDGVSRGHDSAIVLGDGARPVIVVSQAVERNLPCGDCLYVAVTVRAARLAEMQASSRRSAVSAADESSRPSGKPRPVRPAGDRRERA